MLTCLIPFCVQDFVRHYKRFMEQNSDFDQRLGTVLNLAFQHSKNLKSTFKVCLLQLNVQAIKGHHMERAFSMFAYFNNIYLFRETFLV